MDDDDDDVLSGARGATASESVEGGAKRHTVPVATALSDLPASNATFLERAYMQIEHSLAQQVRASDHHSVLLSNVRLPYPATFPSHLEFADVHNNPAGCSACESLCGCDCLRVSRARRCRTMGTPCMSPCSQPCLLVSAWAKRGARSASGRTATSESSVPSSRPFPGSPTSGSQVRVPLSLLLLMLMVCQRRRCASPSDCLMRNALPFSCGQAWGLNRRWAQAATTAAPTCPSTIRFTHSCRSLASPGNPSHIMRRPSPPPTTSARSVGPSSQHSPWPSRQGLRAQRARLQHQHRHRRRQHVVGQNAQRLTLLLKAEGVPATI